jgi:TolA-binding protein
MLAGLQPQADANPLITTLLIIVSSQPYLGRINAESAARQKELEKRLKRLAEEIEKLQAENRKSTRGLIEATAKNVFGFTPTNTPREYYMDHSSRKNDINLLRIKQKAIEQDIKHLQILKTKGMTAENGSGW